MGSIEHKVTKISDGIKEKVRGVVGVGETTPLWNMNIK